MTDDIIQKMLIGLARVKAGRSTKAMIVHQSLLPALEQAAVEASYHVARGENDLEVVGEHAKARNNAVIIIHENIDDHPHIADLLEAIQVCNRRKLPVLVIASGSENAKEKLGNAKPYAERLFDFEGMERSGKRG